MGVWRLIGTPPARPMNLRNCTSLAKKGVAGRRKLPRPSGCSPQDGSSSDQGLLWRQSAELDVLNVDMGRGMDIAQSFALFHLVSPDTVSNMCYHGHLVEAVEALGVLIQKDCCVSKTLFYTVLKRSVVEQDLVLGRRIHAFTVKLGYQSDTFLCNHILRMYACHGRLQDAMDVLTTVAKPDAFTWSAIISAHVKHGEDKRAIQLYHRMRRSNVKPDGHVFVAALQACARGVDLKTGQLLHADLLASGLEPDLFVCNCLVDMYAKCGSLEAARKVFDGLSRKDAVTWNAMISGYSQKGMGLEALNLYGDMRKHGGVAPDCVTFVCLFQACATVGSPALEKGKELHRQIRERGEEDNALVANSLVNMYARCGSLEDARRVFDGLVHREVVTWNAMISGYSRQGMGQQALCMYTAMQEEGITVPNSVTFACLLQACASLGTQALEKGRKLHAQIKVGGHQADVYVASSLVNMYVKCGSLEDAEIVFKGLGEKNEVTWTAILAGYAQQGRVQEVLRLYSSMQEGGVTVPDSLTFVSLLQAFGNVGIPALEKGKQLHAQIRRQGYEGDVVVANSLVNMYAKCGSLEDSRRVFDGLGPKRDVGTWNAMISGYSQQAMGQEALRLYSTMQEEGIAKPDSVTFVCLLQACASVCSQGLGMGIQLHAQIREQGHEGDAFVASGLVNMYAKCGNLEDAQRVFDRLKSRDVVTWTAMIAGYTQQGMDQKVLSLYRDMQEEGIALPDTVTFAFLLQACANVAALNLGRQIHAQIQELGLQAYASLAGSLINMYGKSGSMVDAQQVFDALHERDVFAWSALIAGYSSQGDSELVFDLFQRMTDDGIKPVGITFLSVLTVCSHAGLVNKGRQYFEAMHANHGITPTVEHYTCMVDLLGRAGRLHEALAFINTMRVLPDAAVWHTLLGACRKWSNVEVGQHAFHQAVQLDENDAAAFVLMSNIYAGAQMWEQAHRMQAKRTGIRASQQPGQSWWTNMDGQVHSFMVGCRIAVSQESSKARACTPLSNCKQKVHVSHRKEDVSAHSEKLPSRRMLVKIHVFTHCPRALTYTERKYAPPIGDASGSYTRAIKLFSPLSREFTRKMTAMVPWADVCMPY